MSRIAFISHSSQDKMVGEEVCRFLEKHGVRCWIAPRDVTPGKNYGAAILDAIDECKVFVLVLSHHSNKSGQVVREVERAASSNSILIPFRIEDVQPSRDLEFYVSAAHWLDASTKPLEKHLRELLRAIQDWQRSGGVPVERRVACVAPPVLPVTPRPMPEALSPWRKIALAAGAVVILGGIVAYSFHHRSVARVSVANVPAPSPTQTIAPAIPAEPSSSVTLELETATPSPAASVALSAPPLATPAPSPAISVPRRRPGEPIRTPAPAANANVATAGSPAVDLKPNERVAPATVPAIQEVAATSQLAVGDVMRRPTLAVDGNPVTAWVTGNDGIDQSISIRFKAPTTISSVSILNSIATNEVDFRFRNRVHTVRMTLSNGATQLLNFDDKLKPQRFDLQNPAVAEWVKFDIVSIFRGSKSNHTPIAEIAFNHDVSTVVPASEDTETPSPRPRRSPGAKIKY